MLNPKEKDAIEMYLSRLKEETLSLDEKISYSNLSKERRDALYLLRDDLSIIIKETENGSVVVVWDREDCLREAISQLSEKDVYREVKGDAGSPLMKLIKSVLRNMRNTGDVSDETYIDFICLQKFIKDLIMFQADQLSPIQATLLKIFFLFLISI